MVADTVGLRELQLAGQMAGPLLAVDHEREEAVLGERELGTGAFEHPGEPGEREHVAVEARRRRHSRSVANSSQIELSCPAASDPSLR